MEKFWKNFIKSYTRSEEYWYVNKRLALNKENVGLIKKQLSILKEFEGKRWDRQSQSEYRKHLIKNKLLVRRVTGSTEVDANATVRMLKAIFHTLGLAWVTDNQLVQITDVGNEILKEKVVAEDVVAEQIRRYEFSNPIIKRKPHYKIQLFPYYFLLSLFLEKELDYFDKDEFILFVSRAKNLNETDDVLSVINRWRELKSKEKEEIKTKLQSIRTIQTQLIPTATRGDRGQSVFTTICQNAPYSLSFYTFPPEFTYREQRIRLNPKFRSICQKRLDEFNRSFTYITFKSPKDWIAFYSNLEQSFTVDNAINYYSDTSDVTRALELYREARAQRRKSEIIEKKPPQQFEEEIIQERLIEDYLEYNLGRLERGLKLVKDGRQFETIVGPIDLLAKDKNNNYVVIELKKGRTSDRVFGQISRYLGYVEMALAQQGNLRGIIIGKEVEDRLFYSIQASKFKISLFTFQYDVEFFPAKPSPQFREVAMR